MQVLPADPGVAMTSPDLTVVTMVDSQRERCAWALEAICAQSIIKRMEVLLLEPQKESIDAERQEVAIVDRVVPSGRPRRQVTVDPGAEEVRVAHVELPVDEGPGSQSPNVSALRPSMKFPPGPGDVPLTSWLKRNRGVTFTAANALLYAKRPNST